MCYRALSITKNIWKPLSWQMANYDMTEKIPCKTLNNKADL
jgi:hypothetical protein